MSDSTQLGRGAVAIFRTAQEPSASVRLIRGEIAELNRSLPVTLETLNARVDHLREQPRFVDWLVSLFALFGLALVGDPDLRRAIVRGFAPHARNRTSYGAWSHTGQDRGSDPETGGRAMVGAGLAAGLLAAAALTRLIRALLFDVSPGDPISLAAAIAALVITAALAAWIPARRATGVDPIAPAGRIVLLPECGGDAELAVWSGKRRDALVFTIDDDKGVFAGNRLAMDDVKDP